MIVPGASLPSNDTVSRGTGEATGCSCESSALANTGTVPALRNRPARTATRNRMRRIGSLFEVIPRTVRKRDPRSARSRRRRDASVAFYGDTKAVAQWIEASGGAKLRYRLNLPRRCDERITRRPSLPWRNKAAGAFTSKTAAGLVEHMNVFD